MLETYLFFLAKLATTAILFLLFFFGLLLIIGRAREGGETDDGGNILITDLSEELNDMSELLEEETLSKEAFKALTKQRKKEKKLEKKEKKGKLAKKTDGENTAEPRLFVLRFEGDVEASELENLRETISAVLMTAKENDEILVTIESCGGYVHNYGLAASQLQRIRKKHIPLTVAIDAVAASGGYLMACVANTIIAAPFAIVGSIGVIAELPNFSRLLKRHEIDYELHTAGQYKSTLSMFAENTEKGREKFQEEIEDTHTLFKTFVSRHRPNIDVEAIATGEHWHASQARHLGLVDDISTSDDYILKSHEAGTKIYEISYVHKKSLLDRVATRFEVSVAKLLARLTKTVHLQ